MFAPSCKTNHLNLVYIFINQNKYQQKATMDYFEMNGCSINPFPARVYAVFCIPVCRDEF